MIKLQHLVQPAVALKAAQERLSFLCPGTMDPYRRLDLEQERARKVLSETVGAVAGKVSEGIDRAMALTNQDLADAADDVLLRKDEDLYPCWAALMRLKHLQAQLSWPGAKLDEPLQALVQAGLVTANDRDYCYIFAFIRTHSLSLIVACW